MVNFVGVSGKEGVGDRVSRSVVGDHPWYPGDDS